MSIKFIRDSDLHQIVGGLANAAGNGVGPLDAFIDNGGTFIARVTNGQGDPVAGKLISNPPSLHVLVTTYKH
jgi:hypothetical protein